MNDDLHILIVEDEPRIRAAMHDFLEYHRFKVSEAADGPAAKQLVEEQRFDLILLDLMLPGITGEQLCSGWRQGGIQTPIIMVTAKGQEKERIGGLDLGADDYITKPFSLEEMLARIRAVLRRIDPGRAVGQAFRLGDLDVDVQTLKMTRAGREIEISKREAAIVQYFAANPDRVIGREELYRQVWNETLTDLGTRTVDMHIAKLRAKIEIDSGNPKIIQTVRGAGYKYCPDGG
jgi:DNA-binding response OmpR family regulator